VSGPYILSLQIYRKYEEWMKNMEFYEAVNMRRSVKEFQPRSVEAEKLRRVLKAGLKAPSHNHLREWEFCCLR